MRKAYMKQMAEGRRSGTSRGRRTAGQGDVDWCRQPRALSASIQGQPGTGCLAREGTGAASTRSRGRRDAPTLGGAVGGAAGELKGCTTAWPRGVSAARLSRPAGERSRSGQHRRGLPGAR